MAQMQPTELIGCLRQQIEAMNQAITMLEQGSPCIEIIKHIQLIQVKLHVANGELMNTRLGACLSTTADTNTEQMLNEMSGLFACLEKS